MGRLEACIVDLNHRVLFGLDVLDLVLHQRQVSPVGPFLRLWRPILRAVLSQTMLIGGSVIGVPTLDVHQLPEL